MPTVFKKCPNCGKRFEVERTGKSVEKKTELVEEEKTISPQAVVASYSRFPIGTPPMNEAPHVMVDELIEEDEYTETYKCKHCGHVWTEKHEVVKDLGEVNGAGIDR